jgi:hypothetical protein
MPTKMNLSEEKIRRLRYERFHCSCSKIQKKVTGSLPESGFNLNETEFNPRSE